VLVLIESRNETANGNLKYCCQSEHNVFIDLNDDGIDQSSFCEADVEFAPSKLLQLSFPDSSEGTIYHIAISYIAIIHNYI